MRKIIIKVSLLLLSNIFIINAFIAVNTCVFADAGAKPQLKVKVKNAPSELYYLDLLKNSASGSSNLTDIESYNQDMIKLLFNYSDEGWYPALAGGTNAPIWGDLIGKKESDRMVHTFEYFGLPIVYRLIIVTESGDVQVSRLMTRSTMQSTVVYDYEADIFIKTTGFLSYSVQFAATCIPTLLIELFILLLFGFKIRENWKPFFCMNILTQLLLTVTMSIVLVSSGTVSAYIIMVPTELAIISIEMAIGVKYLKGHSVHRRIAYIMTANVVSAIVGFIWIIPLIITLLSR